MNANKTIVADAHLTGERALFKARDLKITGTVFDDGESPLKESRNIEVVDSVFGWRYPLWYSRGVTVRNTTFLEDVRAGVWYSHDVSIEGCVFAGPKGIRKCHGVHLKDVSFPNGEETLWWSDDVELENVSVKGDYLLQGTSNIHAVNLTLCGKYSFDGCRNVLIEDSHLITKDAFWNAENVTVRNSTIVSEYLAWNARNVTFENCTITSLQGLCYVEGLTLINCRLVDCDLCFEYCTDIDATVTTNITSIKNPISGRIVAPSIGEIIFDDEDVDRTKTEIVLTKRTPETCPCLCVVA